MCFIDLCAFMLLPATAPPASTAPPAAAAATTETVSYSVRLAEPGLRRQSTYVIRRALEVLLLLQRNFNLAYGSAACRRWRPEEDAGRLTPLTIIPPAISSGWLTDSWEVGPAARRTQSPAVKSMRVVMPHCFMVAVEASRVTDWGMGATLIPCSKCARASRLQPYNVSSSHKRE